VPRKARFLLSPSAFGYFGHSHFLPLTAVTGTEKLETAVVSFFPLPVQKLEKPFVQTYGSTLLKPLVISIITQTRPF